MLRKYTLFIVLLVSMFLFTGCGEKEELTAFENDMKNFYDEVSAIESAISQIDASSETAVDNLLVNMEEMAACFQTLANIEVPMEFISIEELADDASAYMDEAVRLYSEAYEEDYISDALVQAATENYESAMKRINYIAILLQGEIPEDAIVVEGDGNEFEPYSEEE